MGDVVPVRSLEEEYRYIQFHPRPCPCGSQRRKVINHGLQILPHRVEMVARIFGPSVLRYLPFLRLRDVIRVGCPECGRDTEYAFDVAAIPHIRDGFRRRFLHHPRDVVLQHMGMVAEFHRRTGAGSFGDLEL